jgi:heterodisulfide reductase subunit D
VLEKHERQLYDCSRCGFCRVWGWEGVEHVCPTYPFTAGWDTLYARGRVRMARATLEGEVEVTQAFLDHAYACTLCGSCEVHCPVGVPLTEIFHEWRVDLAEAGHALPEHKQVVSLVQAHLNPYGPRWDTTDGEAPAPRRKARVLFYPGCTTNRMAEETVQALTGALAGLELDFALFEDDTCCGFPLYEIGRVAEARQVAQQTLGRIAAHEPQILLTTCPACYKTFKSLLPDEMGLPVGFEVQHVSEFLPSYVEGRLAEMPVTVTWHDPCVLGRHLGMYDEPRALLRAIPGLELVEMPANREHALCCGAGGGVYFACQKMANQAVVYRLEQAVQTGAQMIATSCPNCYVRFRQMSRSRRMGIQAVSLSQLIHKALR